MEKLEIVSDALGIIDRLKAWNKNYEVYFNFKKNKFMLYLKENQLKPSVYCLTFPFECIDERMIDYTQQSEIQNREKILKEIEESNARLLKAEQNKIVAKLSNS